MEKPRYFVFKFGKKTFEFVEIKDLQKPTIWEHQCHLCGNLDEYYNTHVLVLDGDGLREAQCEVWC